MRQKYSTVGVLISWRAKGSIYMNRNLKYIRTTVDLIVSWVDRWVRFLLVVWRVTASLSMSIQLCWNQSGKLSQWILTASNLVELRLYIWVMTRYLPVERSCFSMKHSSLLSRGMTANCIGCSSTSMPHGCRPIAISSYDTWSVWILQNIFWRVCSTCRGTAFANNVCSSALACFS